MSPARAKPWLPACGLLALSIGGALHAQDAPGYTEGDYGGMGLLQTPTARMADEGELALSLSRVSPYSRLNVALQPLPWLEGVFRYSDVSNRLYGPKIAGTQSYKDKSIDVKVRLWRESRWLPDVSVGARDIGGTGLFGSQYVVTSKRVGPFDLNLGLGWGYMGGRGDIANPFDVFGQRFRTRAPVTGNTAGGLNTSNYLRGRPAFFGGLEYRTPLDWLRLKLELDGNDYRHEPQDNNQRQRSPLNVGALVRINRNIDLSVGYERGDRVMASISLHSNLLEHVPTPKLLDPPPEPRRATDSAAGSAALAPRQVDWKAISQALQDNAGIRVNAIGQRGRELIVHGEQQRYFYPAEGVGRLARLLDNRVDPSIDWWTFADEQGGLRTVDTSVHRQPFDALLDHRVDTQDFRRSIEHDPPAQAHEDLLYTAPQRGVGANVSVGYKQNLGGPDGFVLYQLTADVNAGFRISRNMWLDGLMSVNLINNYSKFKYTAPSNLPRVRTYLRQYLTTSDITLPVLQWTATHQFSQDVFGMAYAGMLESMYGGVGGELLYRPFGERWALGADVNRVRQRGFRQDFAFRGYQVTTGQATLYLDTGYRGVQVALSAGRYLAGDWGGTLDVSRHFSNGVTMGAWATVTNVSGKRYGEGSFDKGIYFSIPFDLILPRSSRSRATVVWQPLFRDGGARLARRHTLYDLTSNRDTSLFDDNLDYITH